MRLVSKDAKEHCWEQFYEHLLGTRWGSGRERIFELTSLCKEHDSGSVVKPHWAQGVGDADTALQRTSAKEQVQKNKCS